MQQLRSAESPDAGQARSRRNEKFSWQSRKTDKFAPVIVFLASDDAACLTGERISASGGLRNTLIIRLQVLRDQIPAALRRCFGVSRALA